MKITVLIIFLTAFTLASFRIPGSNTQDLRSGWLVYEDGRFVPFEARETNPGVVYLKLDGRKVRGARLEISAVRPFDLYINNHFSASGKRLSLPIDSLAGVFASPNLIVGIKHSGSVHRDLRTFLTSPAPRDPLTEGLVKRESSYFRDFIVVGMLLLMTLGVVVVRLNPKLSSDYFSLSGIFSTREIHESQVYTRIGSSTNILFYVYCSMLLAYYLMVTFHFTTGQFPAANAFQGETFLSTSGRWGELSAYVLMFFAAKIILVFGASYLFGMPQIAGIHFFNWIRLLLVIFGILTLVLFVYVIWHGQSPVFHSVMLKLLGWIMAGWIVLIFLKLAGHASASWFHLFSYICATELIPFLFIIKVLYL